MRRVIRQRIDRQAVWPVDVAALAVVEEQAEWIGLVPGQVVGRRSRPVDLPAKVPSVTQLRAVVAI